jgi:hypothetical protein
MVLIGSAGNAQNVEIPSPKDELALAWLDTVKVAAQFANTECKNLESVKQFNRLKGTVQAKVEHRLPGFTVDWTRFIIVALPVKDNNGPIAEGK